MSRPRMLSSATVLLTAVVGASWYASTLFPILKAAKADVQASAPSAAGDSAAAQSGSRVVLEGDVVLRTGDVTLRASKVEVLLEQQAGNVLAVRHVTPENPIPRRTRGVTPLRPAQFGGAQVVISSLVTLDRNGAVTAVVRDGCSVTDGRNNDDAVCAAFFDAVAAAIRQWRYDRPAQGPIQFYVTITFRPGKEPTVTQSGEGNSADLRETQDGLRRLAETDRDNATVERAVASLQADLARLTAMSRELERAQRLEIERGGSGQDLAKLQQSIAQLNAELARVETQRNSLGQQRNDGRARLDELMRQANELAREFERSDPQVRDNLETQARAARDAADALRRAAAGDAVARAQAEAATERLREAQRQLEAARAERPATGTANVSLVLATPVDGSRQLVSPSGRPPLRVVPPVTAPVPITRVQPIYLAVAMKARVQGTVTVEALVDERGRVADARVVKSIALLDQSALDAARQWEFRPALLNGEAVPVLLQLEMHFTLK